MAWVKTSDMNDSKTFFKLSKKAFGPKSSSVSPLFSKDKSTLYKDSSDILKRWTEHFSELFYNPSVVNKEVIENLHQNDIILEMSVPPSREEIFKAISEVNTGKTPGFDGVLCRCIITWG